MRIRTVLCIISILLIFILGRQNRNNPIETKNTITMANIFVTPSVTLSPPTPKVPLNSKTTSKSSNLVDVGSVLNQVLAAIVAALLISLVGWLTRSVWKPLISEIWHQKSPLKKRKKLKALIVYLQQEKLNLLESIAPGSTNLRVKDIVEGGELFIAPPWKAVNDVSQYTKLMDYLIDRIDKNQRILLLGEAGQGKTIVLKQVFTIMVDRFLANPKKGVLIPIYVPLREFSFSGYDAIEMLWTRLQNKFPLSFDDFNYLARNNHFTFLFDGFDEIRGELTQRSINERATNEIFSRTAVLSCRKNFYDLYLSLSVIQELYPLKVELQRLVFTNSIAQYITAFCNKKRDTQLGILATPPEKIITIIQENQGLKDLTQRPLLLVMIVDIFTDPIDLKDMSESEWNMAMVYQKYTSKWLRNEAAKPDSILRADQKAILMQNIAWSIYREREPVPYGLYQNGTFTRENLFNILKDFTSLHLNIEINKVIDDICLRAFLITNDGNSFSFIHKSFQEYYVAKYIYESMRHKDGNEDYVTQAFQELIPLDVSTFLQDMLMAKELPQYEKEQMAEILIRVYRQNNINNERSATIRQNVCYYLSVLRIQESVQFLERIYQHETNKRVQRAIAVGLAVYCDETHLLEQYIDVLYIDSEAALINTGYYLIHYGDQALEKGFLDKGGENCTGTVREIFYHLKNDRFRNLWLLELITLRMLLESRGLKILNADEQYISFLKQFLDRGYKQSNKIFQQEKRRLEKILASKNKLKR